jgi:hypothetical protein
MDCTGSMERWIQAAKDQTRKMVSDVIAQHGDDVRIRVGFVGYRDYGDDERFVIRDFNQPDFVLEEIRDVHAEGGDDMAEDVAGGLRHLRDLNWDADIKMIFHIADAPAHGLQFHSIRLSDRFPEGDPSGINPLEFMSYFSAQRYNYTFVRINGSTDTMIDQFHNCYLNSSLFRVLDLTPQGRQPYDDVLMLGPALTATITQSIYQHYSDTQDPVEL